MSIFTGDLSREEGPRFRMAAPCLPAHTVIQVLTAPDSAGAGERRDGGVVAG
jgi:hypothetical protein